MLSFVETQRSPRQKAGAITQLKAMTKSLGIEGLLGNNTTVTAFNNEVTPMDSIRKSVATTNSFAEQIKRANRGANQIAALRNKVNSEIAGRDH